MLENGSKFTDRKWKRWEPHPTHTNLVYWSRSKEGLYFITEERAQKNKLKQREANKRYWNTAKGRKAHKDYKAANRELYRKAVRKYRKKNMAAHRMRSSHKRITRSLAHHPDHNPLFELTLFSLAARLEGCLRTKFHLDHVVPIGRNGPHHHTNLRVIPAHINNLKSDRLDEECPPEVQKVLRLWS